MDSPEDVFAAEDRCEVCGGLLGDEIVIQEFADGSLARLCAECAAGAALDEQERPETRRTSVVWPEGPGETPAGGSAEFDPLEKTRELLLPVTDLIALQAEMQSALERLASSLERFATEMLTESQGKTAVESRLQMLERELDKTRTRLAETEFLLVNTLETVPGALADVVETAPAATVPAAALSDTAEEAAERDSAGVTDLDQVAPPFDDLWALATARVDETAPEAEKARRPAEEPPSPFTAVENGAAVEAGPATGAEKAAEAAEVADDADAFETPGVIEVMLVAEAPGAAEAPPVAEAPSGAEAAGLGGVEAAGERPAPGSTAALVPPPQDKPHGTGFRIDEVQAAQRYYNESPFTSRIRDVRNSLGRPKANLTRVPGDEPRAIVTVAWDIVWYQYLVDLRRDLPSTHERVVLHREGMDLDELAYYFKEPNALVNDDGRLDASELEVRLLSDPSALITEMTQAEMQALEDATEEIWDQRVAPEFKWDG